MERIRVKERIAVFGFQVKSFPDGIGEAFDSIIGNVPDGLARSYYGISYIENNTIVYLATAQEKFAGEAEQLGYEKFSIDTGEYNSITVKDWRSKTDTIKNVFMEIMQDDCPDKNKPCVEWYKNDDEMICMVKSGSI